MKNPLAELLETRWVVRAPIPLFRYGFGWVFAGRFLLLEHVGRSSGVARHVVLETVDRPSPDRIFVVSGLGPNAQWYRNVVAEPRCHVSIGRRRRVPATATVVDGAERDDVLDRYRSAHPKAWKKLEAAMLDLAARSNAGASEEGLELPLVRLDLG